LTPLAVSYLFFSDALPLPAPDLGHLAFGPRAMIVGALLLLGGFTLFTGTLVAIGAIMPTAKQAGAHRRTARSRHLGFAPGRPSVPLRLRRVLAQAFHPEHLQPPGARGRKAVQVP
jgi:hypothetical protein